MRPEPVRRAQEHALEVIELPRVLEEIATLSVSEPGRRAVVGLEPRWDVTAVESALAEVDEMVSLLLRFEDWSLAGIPDCGRLLRRLATEGSVLDAEQLGEIGRLLKASRTARGDLRRLPDELPRLARLGGRMLRDEMLEKRLGRSLDPGGGLADGASPDLGRLRRSLRESRSAIVRRLERYARQLPDRLQVPDSSVTIRSGRYCIPIRREGMSQVGGIVHDESATHQTLFVEPPEVIDAMNRIAELEREEIREIQRVLRELTDELRPEASALAESQAALAEADSLYARARYALGHGGTRPAVLDPNGGARRPAYRMVDARHPLLESSGEPVVPFHLELGEDERVLLLSGPNAGGKTVLLKAIGLISAMAQAGIVPPVGPGTVLPLFRTFFAIIGDEQSIQASLSTFSAQVESLRVILEQAGTDSLVLIDELGGSTDPSEGAALAAAVLLRLAGQAGLTVATTHLGELKDLAAHEEAIVNASLQFDTSALRPTFRLSRDLPGRSYALEIAGRLGLPADVLEGARSRLSQADRKVDSLLKELEDRGTEMDRLTAQARVSARRSRETEEELTAWAERLGRREKEIERDARKRAERYLLEARKDVEQEIARLRARATTAERSGGSATLDQAARDARAGVEELLRAARPDVLDDGAATLSAPDLESGAAVRSTSLGVEGTVAELRAGEVVVESGGLRFSLPPGDLKVIGRAASESRPRSIHASMPDIAPLTEIDLRGLRVDEVGSALTPAIDAAVVNDVPSIRIIHGKGTGALRDEVARLLKADRRVPHFRPGGFQEGGAGVTVIEFADPRD